MILLGVGANFRLSNSRLTSGSSSLYIDFDEVEFHELVLLQVAYLLKQ